MYLKICILSNIQTKMTHAHLSSPSFSVYSLVIFLSSSRNSMVLPRSEEMKAGLAQSSNRTLKPPMRTPYTAGWSSQKRRMF